MPTPVFTVRLSHKARAELDEMSKLYGASSGRAFAREILETMISGDRQKVESFLKRLFMRAGEQLALNLSAIAMPLPQKPAKKARSGRKRGRRPKPV